MSTEAKQSQARRHSLEVSVTSVDAHPLHLLQLIHLLYRHLHMGYLTRCTEIITLLRQPAVIQHVRKFQTATRGVLGVRSSRVDSNKVVLVKVKEGGWMIHLDVGRESI